MNKLQVKSSTIKTVAYNYENGKLEIEFIRGVTYQYEEVPVHIVCCLLFQAESVGSYFNKNIAKTYKYKKLGEQ